MRIHAAPEHPAYHPDIFLRARILFNGAPVSEVISADDAAGEVIRYTGATNAAGQMITETLVGRVQICLPDELGHLRYSFMPNPRV